MRLDKYLKISRLIKRRTVANEACDAGRVLANGKPARASYEVKAGDVLDFGGLLGHAPIMPISKYSPAVMIHRGGRIPAPMQALKN